VTSHRGLFIEEKVHLKGVTSNHRDKVQRADQLPRAFYDRGREKVLVGKSVARQKGRDDKRKEASSEGCRLHLPKVREVSKKKENWFGGGGLINDAEGETRWS